MSLTSVRALARHLSGTANRTEKPQVVTEGIAPALLFRDVSCKVTSRSILQCPPLKKNTIQIIGDCSGYIERGEVACILGGSGAGKTTLLDILSKRKNNGHIEGEVLYNGRHHKGHSLPTVMAGYVRQDDYHIGALTVYQTLKYAAKLRCHHIPESEWQERIKKLLVALNLNHKKHQLVGDKLIRGLSGGESRRLSIAVEMLNDPEILFLDEPTSGLDSSSSLSVAALLQRLVRTRNTAALCTIHQPSREVFAYFDKCIVLAKVPGSYGRIVYFGPTPALENYLNSIDYPLPRGANIADFVIQLCSVKKDPALLDIFGAALEGTPGRPHHRTPGRVSMEEHRSDVVVIEDEDSSSDKSGDKPAQPKSGDSDPKLAQGEDAESVRNMTEAWLESQERKILMQELDAAKEKPPATSTYAKWKPPPLYLQMWVLWLRRMQAVLNNREATFAPIIIFLVLYTIIATGFWRMGHGSNDVQNRVSLIFFLMIMSFLTAQPYLNMIINERVLFIHEKTAKLYSALPYYLSILFASMPVIMIIQSIYTIALYWATNLNNDPGRFFIFMLVYLLCVLMMMHYTLALGASCPTEEAAMGLSSILFSIFILFNGFFILNSSIRDWWIWANWISPFKYVFYVGINNEFRGVEFDCGRSNGTDCGFKNGQELLDFYDVSNSDLIWPYISVVFGFLVLWATITVLALRYLRYDKH